MYHDTGTTQYESAVRDAWLPSFLRLIYRVWPLCTALPTTLSWRHVRKSNAVLEATRLQQLESQTERDVLWYVLTYTKIRTPFPGKDHIYQSFSTISLNFLQFRTWVCVAVFTHCCGEIFGPLPWRNGSTTSPRGAHHAVLLLYGQYSSSPKSPSFAPKSSTTPDIQNFSSYATGPTYGETTNQLRKR